MINNRKNNNENSTRAIYNLLNEVISHPEKFINDTKLIKSLNSQKGIAILYGTWQCQREKVEKNAMTLNTLKKHSINLLSDRFDNGWTILNELRIKAKESIENRINEEHKPTKRSKNGLKQIIEEKEDTLEKQKAVNFILLQALSSAMQTIKIVSETPDKELRNERASRGLDRLRAVVSLNQPPFNKVDIKNNVISILSGNSDE
ncbi:hypothetical protein ACEQ8A_002756 [Vibrio fluvialis]